ncbi:hypothetical protein TNCV_4553321 [Trichonephila clavipes]|nr:hypothetical protein TNCV_4553321 [Trichonephila clavipes]
MSSGRSLPQVNLGVQGGIQVDSHKFDNWCQNYVTAEISLALQWILINRSDGYLFSPFTGPGMSPISLYFKDSISIDIDQTNKNYADYRFGRRASMTSIESWSERTDDSAPPSTTSTGLGASPSRTNVGDDYIAEFSDVNVPLFKIPATRKELDKIVFRVKNKSVEPLPPKNQEAKKPAEVSSPPPPPASPRKGRKAAKRRCGRDSRFGSHRLSTYFSDSHSPFQGSCDRANLYSFYPADKTFTTWKWPTYLPTWNWNWQNRIGTLRGHLRLSLHHVSS